MCSTLLMAGCAASVKSAPEPEYIPPPPPVAKVEVAPEVREARADARVGVHGIEGTLSNFDVRIAMEKRGLEFGACHEPRARRVPRLSGNVEFAIRVRPDGAVSQVRVRNSDVGDRPLERCFASVIESTPFPRPNGGEANVVWSMILGPARPGKDPEQWELERIASVLDKHAPELRETCAVPSDGTYQITAYVNRKGRVITAGVSAQTEAAPELLDCLASGLSRWRMPTPKKAKLAKVTFALAPHAPQPLAARQRL